MNLLRTVIMVTRGPETAATAVDLADLRATAQASSYTWFQDRAWLDQDMIVALITLLERWSAGPETFRCYLPDTRNLDEQARFKELFPGQLALLSNSWLSLLVTHSTSFTPPKISTPRHSIHGCVSSPISLPIPIITGPKISEEALLDSETSCLR